MSDTSSSKAPSHEPDMPGGHEPNTNDPRKAATGPHPDPHGDHPRGTPNSDRHAAETLAGRLAKHRPAENKPK